MSEFSPKNSFGETIFSWGAKLSKIPLVVRIIISLVLLGIVAFLDYITGAELSFSIFYLVPVAFAGALVSRKTGAVMAVLGAAEWGFLELTTGEGFSADWIIFWNSIVRLGFFLILNEFIDHLKRSHLILQELSRKDSLTGIPNSRVFEEEGNILIGNNCVFSLAYIDLDGFKSVNDEFGHSEGDAVLKSVASIIQKNIRKTDNVARLGGDEFGILMPDTDVDNAKSLVERISTAIISEVGTRWHIGATFGVITFEKTPSSWDFAVHQADILMYRGKKNGRNMILVSSWPDSKR
jgi:diguanylate cyclase (GGDEF)-like protein